MDDKIEKFQITNGISLPPKIRLMIEFITLGAMLGGFYWALSGRIDIMSERIQELQKAHVHMEQSVKDVLQEHDKRLDAIEQGTAPVIKDMKEEIKTKRR